MEQATKVVKIIEKGDKIFRFTCPVPGGINELMHRPYSDSEPWDTFTDLGDKGFEVQIKSDHRNGDYGGMPRIMDVIYDIWAELHKADLVQTGEIPEITFGVKGSVSTNIAAPHRRR